MRKGRKVQYFAQDVPNYANSKTRFNILIGEPMTFKVRDRVQYIFPPYEVGTITGIKNFPPVDPYVVEVKLDGDMGITPPPEKLVYFNEGRG